MARRKIDNILALAPQVSNLSAAASIDLAPWSSRRSFSQEEDRMIEKARQEELAVEIKSTLTNLAEEKLGEIHRHASQTFDVTAGFIIAIREQPGRSAVHQAVVDQFSEGQLQLYAQHTLSVLDVGATGIGIEVHRSPYPPPLPVPKPRVGLLRRLLGE